MVCVRVCVGVRMASLQTDGLHISSCDFVLKTKSTTDSIYTKTNIPSEAMTWNDLSVAKLSLVRSVLFTVSFTVSFFLSQCHCGQCYNDLSKEARYMSMYLNLFQISGVIGVILKNTNFRNYKPIAVYIKVDVAKCFNNCTCTWLWLFVMLMQFQPAE